MYEPNEAKREWADAQMSSLQLGQPIKTAVLRLLDVWWTMNHTHDSMILTLDTFHRLAQGFALVPADPPEERWIEVKPGNIIAGAIVRVKSDAYGGNAGEAHNARKGRVIAIRQGDIIVKYTDGGTPSFEGVHHSPYALEQLR